MSQLTNTLYASGKSLKGLLQCFSFAQTLSRTWAMLTLVRSMSQVPIPIMQLSSKFHQTLPFKFDSTLNVNVINTFKPELPILRLILDHFTHAKCFLRHYNNICWKWISIIPAPCFRRVISLKIINIIIIIVIIISVCVLDMK